MRMLIVVLASVVTASAAHAEKVGIVVTGEATLQPQVASQLERWLHDRGRTYVPGALEPEAISTLIDCFVLEDLACARGVVDARAKSRSLVYARIDQTANRDGTRDVSITGYWFQKGHESIAERRMCTQCNDGKLIESVDAMMLALAHAPPLPGEQQPPAATVAPRATSDETERPAQSKRMLHWGLIGAGTAAFLGGVVMIGIDQDPDPNNTTSPTYRDTATVGTMLAVGGAAALGVGLYLWITDKPGSHPIANISGDGASVGWAGSF